MMVDSFKELECKVCGCPVKAVFTIDGYPLYECSSCTHRMIFLDGLQRHRLHTFSDEYFFGGGAGYPDYHFESDLLVERGKAYARLASMKGVSRGNILEIGCSAGYLLQGFRECGWNVAGIEVNECMQRFAREKMGLDVALASAETFESEKRFNLVALVQVLEHLVDPHTVLEQVGKHLNPEGAVLVETWNYKSLTARLLGKGWHQYSPPGVVHWYTPESLDTLFQEHGFTLSVKGRLAKKIRWKHAKSLLAYKLKNRPIALAMLKCLNWIPDGFTLTYPSEDLFYVIYTRA